MDKMTKGEKDKKRIDEKRFSLTCHVLEFGGARLEHVVGNRGRLLSWGVI